MASTETYINPATDANAALMGWGESLADVLKRGNKRESLEALRDYLCDQLTVETPEYVVVKVTQQLVSIIKEIDGVPRAEAASVADELKRKREARRAGAASAAGAAG